MAENNSNNPAPQKDPFNKKAKKPNNLPKFNFYWIYGIIVVTFLAMQFAPHDVSLKTTKTKFFTEMLPSHDIEKIVVVNKERVDIYIKKESLKNAKYSDLKSRTGIFASTDAGPHYFFEISDVGSFETDLTKRQEAFPADERLIAETATQHNYLADIIGWLLPFALLIGLWMFVMRRMGGGGGGGGGQIFNIGKSRAQLFDKDQHVNTTFKDVAGLDEAKVEVMEIVDFLKNPKKYTTLGGKIPKGALLVGPPGTGKTLLAKAVAGEAGVPFFSLSGSDFVEMFVGVGASRVRDLFKQAKEKAPCIIFIDEIDAVGRARGKNLVQGGNDERENTLNQLLTEMDGFATDLGVIILAATNRPDILDTALLRPGRFDRQISIDRPDLNGREEIFKVHLKPIKTAEGVDPMKLSIQTAGFAGADIANVCNEAALIAARNNKTAVDMQDFQDAVDRIIGGLEKKNKIISPEEKLIIAYHESGHAIAGWFLEGVDPLVKVSIVPRGVAALGYAQYLPKDQYLYTTDQMKNMMCMTLGGRVAEDIVFGRISTGAQNDLERITKMAYGMVTIYGMNAKIGNVSFNDSNQEYGFTKPYSESTAEMIDQEVRSIIDECYQKTKQLLLDKRDKLEELSQILLKKEILFQTDLVEILGVRPHDKVEEPIQEAEIIEDSVSHTLAEPKQEESTEIDI
ncbi:MAG: ATP-dependent zinc metalloprotease FtsH [Sphingobacteriales bacterium]|jgi:cell division protease FtsH|nr:ATP-dependent zinc metalloprotease FtsH [Sphingobacteriales bacterium]